jgi:hypothetical protein
MTSTIVMLRAMNVSEVFASTTLMAVVAKKDTLEILYFSLD